MPPMLLTLVSRALAACFDNTNRSSEILKRPTSQIVGRH